MQKLKSKTNKVIVSNSLNPYFNLAYEEYLITKASDNDVCLFLWQSKNAVVIGSNQNPWKECNLQKIKDDHVNIARRLSGGGAVFHDLGNINFSFVTNKSLYDEQRQFKVIKDALAEIGIKSEFSGRNDLLVNGKKISGNAYYFNGDRCMHHGTLLIDVDVTNLLKYLTVSKKKLVSKGIDSVVSRVINLKEINCNLSVEVIENLLKKSFEQIYGTYIFEEIDESVNIDKQFDELLNKYSSWDWIYGNSPSFEMIFDERFSWGDLQINAELKNAEIKSIQIFSDSLNLNFIDKLKLTLLNVKNNEKAIAKSINDVDWTETEKDMIKDILGKWFTEEIYCG